MYRKIIWPLLVLLSITLISLFIIGFSISVNISSSEAVDDVVMESELMEADTGIENNNQDSSEETISIDKSKLPDNPKILVMGDSIGFGFGDDGNTGIGNRYAKLSGINIQENPVNNISVSGDEVEDLLMIVNNEENESLIKAMDLIIISIGGNDLNRIQYKDTVELEINYQESLKAYKESLESILQRIRFLNPKAQLAFVGLYDPYANNEQKTKLLLNWNYETRLLILEEGNAVYIPTYENFQYNLDQYLAFDQFHPSAKGYQYIAEELYEILNGSE